MLNRAHVGIGVGLALVVGLGVGLAVGLSSANTNAPPAAMAPRAGDVAAAVNTDGDGLMFAPPPATGISNTVASPTLTIQQAFAKYADGKAMPDGMQYEGGVITNKSNRCSTDNGADRDSQCTSE